QPGGKAVARPAQLHPRFVTRPLPIPRLKGAEATRQILKAAPATKIIVLSTYGDDEHVQQALAAGAAAYLLKQTAAEDVITAIREVARGNAYFSPAIAKRLREQTTRPQPEPEATRGPD